MPIAPVHCGAWPPSNAAVPPAGWPLAEPWARGGAPAVGAGSQHPLAAHEKGGKGFTLL